MQLTPANYPPNKNVRITGFTLKMLTDVLVVLSIQIMMGILIMILTQCVQLSDNDINEFKVGRIIDNMAILMICIQVMEKWK